MAQSFYIRLITLVDDFGRHEAEPALLRSYCFPLREDITTETINSLCRETSEKLVTYYEKAGKRYLQLMNWTEKPRANSSKLPGPDDAGSLIIHYGEGKPAKTEKPKKPETKPEAVEAPNPDSKSPYADPKYSLMLRVGGWFGRPRETQWQEKERKALNKVFKFNNSEEELNALDEYYSAEIPQEKDYRRRALYTLLNNWQGEIDRARRWVSEKRREQTTHDNGF